jgi:hypothetical protein
MSNENNQWRVHVTIYGNDAGYYTYATKQEAEQDIAERSNSIGRLGFHYKLIPPVKPKPLTRIEF